MDKLTESEKKSLLNVVKKIRNYKLMQAKGYERIAGKADDKRTKGLLLGISKEESKDSDFWSNKIEELGGKPGGVTRNFLLNLRIRLMMSILGTRGFFEWAIIAEDEGVENLAILAGNIRDEATSMKWSRIAADERLHIERMKKEVLGMEGWEMSEGGGVRDMIFGANDGLISILALVAGVFGAINDQYALLIAALTGAAEYLTATNSQTILIAGVAGAVAGAISMAAGAYLSSKSEKEVKQKENRRKGIRKKQSPKEELEELVKFYQARGFKKQEAEAVAKRVSSKLELTEELSIGEEVGITAEQAWSPTKAGTLTGLSFAIASVIPIVPFAFMDINTAVITAVIASIATLFGVGASKAIFTRQSWVRSGLEMMIIGTLAAAATYVIGLIIPV